MGDASRGPGARDQGPGPAAFAGFGLQFVAALLVFLYLGQWVDRRLGTSPVFLVIGIFVGAGGSFYAMYRKLMAAQAREDEARRMAKQGAAVARDEEKR